MLAFTPNFQHKPNFVLPLAVSNEGATLRVASLSSSVLGSVSVSGADASKISLSLKSNPSWVTSSVDATTSTIQISFTGAIPQVGFHEFFILAQDGVAQYLYPIALEVREPFFLLEEGSATTQGLFSIPSYDNTFPDVVIRGYGSNNQVVSDGINILPPKSLSGLNFVTKDGSSLKLRVDPSRAADIAGGLKTFVTAATTSQVLIKAYRKGTMYDTPERTFDKVFAIQSKSAKEGQLYASLTSVWNDTAGYLSLSVKADYLGGKGKDLRYHWSVSGVSGTTASGGTTTDPFWNWTPTGSGEATLRVQIKDTEGTILTTRLVTANVAPSGSWAVTPSLKILSSLASVSAYQGEQASITISTPSAEVGPSDNVNLTFTLKGYDGTSPSIALAAPAPVVLTKASPSTVVNLTLPSSPIKYKWVLQVYAAIGTSRVGRAQVVLESLGPLPLQVSAPSSLSQTTGSSITPFTPTVTNVHGASVTGSTIELVGAPDGLLVNADGSISGSVPTVGTYTFQVWASKDGYTSGYKSITLTVTKGASRLLLGNLTTASKVHDDNTAFNFNWSYSGTPTQVTLQKNQDPAVDVTGSTGCSSFIFGPSVFSLKGFDYAGASYTVPVAINSSSATQTSSLPNSPVVGVIDQNHQLTLSWNPLAIQGSYSLYRGWNVQTKINGGGASSLGVLTGLTQSDSSSDSRVHRAILQTGSVSLNMFPVSNDPSALSDGSPWDSFLDFPEEAEADAFTLDKISASKGEAITITLNPAYTGADSWRIVYGDRTTSDWFPISVKSTAKSFSVAGSMTVTLELQKEYPSQSAKLRRSVTKSVYVLDQTYNPGEVGSNLGAGSLGIGGEAGFEITDSTVDSTTEPYEVIVRALVKDELTQEVKLLVATSRTQDASSLLGTMAIDVFPVPGRPHLKDLVKIGSETLATSRSLPVKVSTKVLPECVVGKAMKETRLTASGGTAPYSWFSDNLPFGSKLSSDGTLSGAVLQAGTHAINVSVKDSSSPCNIDQTTLYLIAKSDLAVTAATPTDAKVGSKYSFSLTALGGIPPYTWRKVSGSLPVGVNISSEGKVQGYPASYNSSSDFEAPFVFTAEVSDSVGSKATGQFSVNLLPADLTLGSPDQSLLFEGQDTKLTLPVYGGAAPYQVTSLVSDGVVKDSLRLIHPDVLVAIAGVAATPLSVTTNAQSFTFSTTPGQGVQKVSFNLDAQGGSAPYIWSLDLSTPAQNTLPGVTVSSNGVVSAEVTVPIGTRPTTLNYTFVAKVTDQNGAGKSATKLINVGVQLVPTVTDTNITLRVVRVDRAEAYPVPGNFVTSTLVINKLSQVSGVSVLPWAVPNKTYRDPESGSNQYVAIVLWDENGNQPLHDSQILNSWSVEVLGESIENYKKVSSSKVDLVSGLSFMGLGSNANKPLWYVGTDGNTPMATGLTPQGANVVVLKANVDLTSFGKTASEEITGVFCLSVAGPAAGTFVAAAIPAQGALSLPLPVLSTKPNLEIRFTKNINSDGTENRVFTSSSSPVLSAIGGKPGYTFNVIGGVQGWSLSDYVTLGWNSASNLNVVTPGFSTVTINTSDVNGNSYNQTLSCSVVQNIASLVSVDILSNTLPAYMEIGKSYTGQIETNTPCNFQLVNLNGFTITGNGTTRATISGTMPMDASGAISYSVLATSTIDTTKASNKAFTANAFTKSITIDLAQPTAEAGVLYSLSSNNALVTINYYGFGLAEFASCSVNLSGTTPLPTVTSNQPVVVSDGSTSIPLVRVVYDFIAAKNGIGVVNIWAGNGSVSSAEALTVTAPSVQIVGRTDTIPVSEYDVDGAFKELYLDFPVNVSGGTAPYTLSILSVSNPEFSNCTVVSDKIKLVVAQAFVANRTYSTNMTIQVQDAAGVVNQATGIINLVINQENYIIVAPLIQSIAYQDGLGARRDFAEGHGWMVDHGHGPYTFSVTNLTVDSNLAAFITTSPSKRVFRYNDSDSDMTDPDMDGRGNFVGGAIWTTPKRTTHPVNGTYRVTADITVTDSKGIQGTVTTYVVVSVNIVSSPVYYSVAVSSGTGGSITPAGTTSYDSGTSPVFTITPDTGYNISAVLVDGVNVGAVGTYTINNISANHTITASFTKITVGPSYYTITSSAGSGGTISPSGSIQVPTGTDYTFAITPNSGYTIGSVTVDGSPVGAVSSYTFTNVTAAHTISVSYSPVVTGNPTQVNNVSMVWTIRERTRDSRITGFFDYTPATDSNVTSSRVRYELVDSFGVTVYSSTLGLSIRPVIIGVSDSTPGEYTMNLTFEDLNSSGAVIHTYSTFVMLVPDYKDITCPVPETNILISQSGSTKMAGDLVIGDTVFTANESGVWGDYAVSAVSKHVSACCEIVLENGSRLIASLTHPVLSANGWVTLEDLNIGELVLPGMSRVKDIIPAGSREVVKLTVDGAHTFIANGIMSHNKPYEPDRPYEI